VKDSLDIRTIGVVAFDLFSPSLYIQHNIHVFLIKLRKCPWTFCIA